jgi:transposase
MGLVLPDDGWRIPDGLWAKIEPLLPPRRPHPLGCHNPRVPDRRAMDAILFVLRTGCLWGALDATGLCSHASAHRRFVEWTEAGVFERLWAQVLSQYDEEWGIDWTFLAADGVMTKAPLGGKKYGSESHRSRQEGYQTAPGRRRQRHSSRTGRRGRKPKRLHVA